jgi:hypothetical protein
MWKFPTKNASKVVIKIKKGKVLVKTLLYIDWSFCSELMFRLNQEVKCIFFRVKNADMEKDMSTKTKFAIMTNLFLINCKKNIQVNYSIGDCYCDFQRVKIDFEQIFISALSVWRVILTFRLWS